MLKRHGCGLAAILLATMTAFGGELTGTWTGTFEELAPDGSVRRTAGAYRELRLSGPTVTGTAGSSGSDQRAISNGKLDGAES